MIDKNVITRLLQDWIDQMERSGKHVNLDDINCHLGEIMHSQNAAPKPNFNGFSSEQMHQMLNRPLEVGCPVQLYSLWLLHHYGVDWRDTRFYADEYSKSFPMLNAGHGYEYRVFNRLFRYYWPL